MTIGEMDYRTEPPANAKPGQWWYVDGDGKGFTSLPDRAQRDRNGVPMLCPGDMTRVWNAEYKRLRAKRDRVWEMLLDTMEEKIEIDEVTQEGDEYEFGRRVIKERIDLLHSVLAVLELPDGKYDQNPTEAVETIAKKAQQKYEAST